MRLQISIIFTGFVYFREKELTNKSAATAISQLNYLHNKADFLLAMYIIKVIRVHCAWGYIPRERGLSGIGSRARANLVFFPPPQLFFVNFSIISSPPLLTVEAVTKSTGGGGNIGHKNKAYWERQK